MGPGFFGGLFDFDHDGELDSFERAMDFMAFEELMSEDEEEDDYEDEDEYDDEDDYEEDW